MGNCNAKENKFKHAKYWRKNIHELRNVLTKVHFTIELAQQEDDISENNKEIIYTLEKVCEEINTILDNIREDIINFNN